MVNKIVLLEKAAFLTCVLVFSLSGWAQVPKQSIELPEVGWSIILPEGFDILDSSGISASLARGKKAIAAPDYHKLNAKGKKILISAKKRNNSFMSSVISFDEKVDGKWENSIQIVRDVYYQTIIQRLPSLQFDSLTSFAAIDSLKFSKFIVQGRQNDTVVFTTVMLNKLYMGYDFGVAYAVVEDAVKAEIEKMLLDSKFSNK